jgi:DNA-binding transcriptional MerR regulator
LVSSGELADELGLSRRSISRYVQKGWLKPTLVTPGGQYRWDVEEVRKQFRELQGRGNP